jgi:transposase InsO family protein
MRELTEKYGIQHWNSSPYHPQANGQVESTNKVLEAILTKNIQFHHRDWADRLPEDLWAYQTTWRNTTGHTPYDLVYEKQVLLPIEFQVRTFCIATKLGLKLDESQKQRSLQLNELDEIRQDVIQRRILVQK